MEKIGKHISYNTIEQNRKDHWLERFSLRSRRSDGVVRAPRLPVRRSSKSEGGNDNAELSEKIPAPSNVKPSLKTKTHPNGLFCFGKWYRLCYAILLLLPSVAMAEKKDAGSGNRVLRNIPIKANQGVAVDQKYFYAISNIQIAQCDKETGKVIVTWKADKKASLYKHFQHLNSGTVTRVEGLKEQPN